MLSTITSINQQQFSRKPIPFSVQAQDNSAVPYGAKPAAATLLIDSNIGFTVGDTLIVILTMVDGTVLRVIFTASAGNTAEDEILDYVSFGGASVQEYYDGVSAKIMAHSLLSPFLTVRAENYAPDFLFTFTTTEEVESIDLQRTIVTTTTVGISPKVADNTPDNYGVSLEIYLELTYRSNNWIRIIKNIHRSPVAASMYYFNVAEVLHSAMLEVMNDLPVPQFNDIFDYPANNQRRFYLKFGERYGSPVAQQPWEVTSIAKVWRGGDSLESTFDYFQLLTLETSFLTYYKKRKVVPNQPEWITWYNWTDTPHTVCLRVRQYDAHNNLLSTSYFGAYSFTTVTEPTDCVMLPCGMAQVGVSSVSGTPVARYTVQVINRELYVSSGPAQTVSILSPIQTFDVLDLYAEDMRFLQYYNSFGAIETLRCSGKWTVDFAIERNSSVSFTESAPYGISSQTDENFERILTYRTGFLDKQEARVLEELLITGHAWDVSVNYVFGLELVSNKFQLYETWRDLNAYELQFKLRKVERNYKNDDDIRNGIGGWYNAAQNGFWTDTNGDFWAVP